MSPAHVEAGRSIKNAVANKAIVYSKIPELYGGNILFYKDKIELIKKKNSIIQMGG